MKENMPYENQQIKLGKEVNNAIPNGILYPKVKLKSHYAICYFAISIIIVSPFASSYMFGLRGVENLKRALR